MVLILPSLHSGKYRTICVISLLRRNVLICGLAQIVVPFISIEAIDIAITTAISLASGRLLMLKRLKPSIVMRVTFTAITSLTYTLGMTDIAQVLLPQAG